MHEEEAQIVKRTRTQSIGKQKTVLHHIQYFFCLLIIAVRLNRFKKSKHH